MAPFFKTRLAPTPSGFLHAGNALNFLLTATLARRFGARLLLRIDDLDRLRCRPAYLSDIFDTLYFLGIEWQEGPRNPTELEEAWSQQHRLLLYHQALDQLNEKNRLFACACTRTAQGPCPCHQQKLPLDDPGLSWRLLTGNEPITVTHADGTKSTASLPQELKNFVVRRKDGVPAYQLASVVDDLYFGIDFIVRGEDLWPSTLAQLYLARVLEQPAFEATAFLHHSLLKNAGGEKLSKSAGADSVKHWREEGRVRADFLPYLGELLQAKQKVHSGEDLAAVLQL